MRRKWLSGCLAVCVMAMSMVGLPLAAEASPQEAASTTDVVHNHQDKTWKEWNSYISKINGENMYLTKDLEISKNNAVNIFGKTTICLNGHQLNCLGQLHIQKGAEVTICDCGTQSREGYIDPDGLWQEGQAPTDGTPYPLKGGVITGHQIVNPVIKNDSGKLLMDSVNIAGNSSTTTEGELIDCVSLKGVLTEVALKNCVLAGNRNQCLTVGEMCKASIEGCKISHNQTSAKGGAIYANRKSCNVELNKTEVRDNTSLRSDWEGSALYITEGCSLTMRDSKVIDNHSENGYGIFCWNNGQLKLGSNSVIHGNGNGGCNVLLNDTPIQLIGPIDHGHKIGVSRKLTQGTVAPKEWTFTKDWNTHMPGSHPAEYFYSEQPGYIVSPNSNDEGIFMAGDTYPIIYKDLGGGIFSGGLPEGAVKIHQLGTATVLPEPTKDGYVFKGWYTDYTGNGAPLTEIAATYNQTPVVYAKWVKAVQAPTITKDCSDIHMTQGNEATLLVDVQAEKDATVSYQWYQTNSANDHQNGTAVAGATTNRLTIGRDTPAGTYYYYCVATASRDGLSASTTSKVATVVVNKPALQAPIITVQPKNLTLDYGEEGDLSVQATSPTDDALSYQWYKTEDMNSTTNGSVIDGATQSTLKVGKDAKPGSYYYYCVVTAGRDTQQLTTTSSIATVTVNKPDLQAPSITEQPTDLTLVYGAEGSLSVKASSPTDDVLSYQWFQTADKNSTTNGTAIDGATQSTLTVGKDAKPSSYYYYCVVTASRDTQQLTTTSSIATVTVNKPDLKAPTITEQPTDLTLVYGEEGDLSVQATSPTDDVLSYQWYRAADKNSTTNGNAIDGATQSTLTVGKDAKPGCYYYYCVVTASRDGVSESITSNVATVTVNKPDLQAPSITEQPTDLTLAYGAEESLSVQATSPTDDALSYQWYQTADKNSTTNATTINGATQSTLTVGKDAKPGSYYYYCVVTASRDGLSASTTSKVATVVVNKPALQAPSITEQPKNLTLDYGAEESLSVQATSPTDDALSYQWYQTADKNSTTNATTINGATQSTLTVGKDAKPGSYYYYCVVTASRDTQQLTTTSSIATVTVNKPSTPPSKPNPQPPVQNPGETVTHPDGSVTTTVTKPNGTTVATTVSPNGDKLILTTYPEGSVEVAVSGTTPRVVTVPVKDVSAGTVPLVTDCNGKQTVVQRSVVTAEGVVLSVNDGDVIEFLHKVPSFADVPDAHWAKDAIIFAWARGLVVGVDDTHFAPEALTTRAMIWSILSRMEGVSSVGGEHWYQPGQEWAMANGVSDGTMPEASITREQLAAMLYRYAGSPDAKGNLSGYRDASMVNDWAQDAMIWAVDEGIVAGMTADTLVPQGTATRAQTAAMLERFISWQLGVQTK